MWKKTASLTLALLATASAVPAAQKEKPNPAAPAPSKSRELTAEEKEILKHRELLENLDLLLNFEQIKYLDFFADKKSTKSKEKPGAKSQVKDNANKSPN